MQVKTRNKIGGVAIGFVAGAIMLLMDIGNSWIRTGIFGACAILLPFLIEAIENKLRPGSR